MNIENIKIVRDFIATLPEEKFRMDDWTDIPSGFYHNHHRGMVTRQEFIHDCGTAACIGGWTNVLFSDADAPNVQTDSDLASRQIGISYMMGNDLFTPDIRSLADPDIIRLHWTDETITTAEAVRVLDILMETGRVRWDLIVEAREVAPEVVKTEADSGLSVVAQERVLELA